MREDRIDVGLLQMIRVEPLYYEYGWTPEEVERLPIDTVDRLLGIIHGRSELSKISSKKGRGMGIPKMTPKQGKRFMYGR